MNKNYYLVNLQQHGDKRGKLDVAEYMKEIPFKVQRIFFNYDTNTEMARADHANKNSKFFMISLKGRCKVEVDDGSSKQSFVLDSPETALYINSMVWKRMYDFTQDNILLILSDCCFDAEEYVEDYNSFIKIK